MSISTENWHIIGYIPRHISSSIGLSGRVPVWISDKIIAHIEKRHGNEIRHRNTSVTAFVHKVVSNFNAVYRQPDGTLILAIEGSKTSMVTYVKLHLSGTQNFWRVSSAHTRKTSEIRKYRLLWSKK